MGGYVFCWCERLQGLAAGSGCGSFPWSRSAVKYPWMDGRHYLFVFTALMELHLIEIYPVK